MSFVATFTDPQGTTFVDAYFEVSISNINESKSSNYDNRISEGVEDTHEHASYSLSYEMLYWRSLAAKENGALPYILANPAPMGLRFNLHQDSVGEYADMTPVEAAEHHCQTYVLPDMQNGGA